MNFYDKITGNDMTRSFKEFEKRAKALPADYQETWAEFKAEVWQYSDLTGRNLPPIMDGVLGLLEEGAADGLKITDVLDDDLPGFTAAVAGAEGAATYRDKWREQLNRAVAKKLGE